MEAFGSTTEVVERGEVLIRGKRNKLKETGSFSFCAGWGLERLLFKF